MKKKIHLTLKDLPIHEEDIALCMGYKDKKIPEPYNEIINETLSGLEPYCNIRGGYVIKENTDLDHKKHRLTIDNILLSLNKVVSSQIKNSEHIAVFYCTAGEGISQWANQLMNEGDLLKGYAVDTLGTVVVEHAMDKVQRSLNEVMHDLQLKTTNRYSPGYCDWNVSDQHQLFKLFPEGFCDIRLSDTALMDPIKSVSGIIGIGQHVRFNEYTCNFCSRTDCVLRNVQLYSSKA